MLLNFLATHYSRALVGDNHCHCVKRAKCTLRKLNCHSMHTTILFIPLVCRCFNSETKTVRKERVRHARALHQDWLAGVGAFEMELHRIWGMVGELVGKLWQCGEKCVYLNVKWS